MVIGTHGSASSFGRFESRAKAEDIEVGGMGRWHPLRLHRAVCDVFRRCIVVLLV